MYDFMKQIPKMLVGEELQKALTYLPEYNENIRNAGADIRLVYEFIEKYEDGLDLSVRYTEISRKYE